MTNNMGLRIDDLMDMILSLFDEFGNLTTGALVDMTGKSRATVTKRLDQLSAAGCIDYLHEPTALWQLIEDPRAE